MMLMLVLGAALGAQDAPAAAAGPAGRFIVCPGNRRCPRRLRARPQIDIPGIIGGILDARPRRRPPAPSAPPVGPAPPVPVAAARPLPPQPTVLRFGSGQATLTNEARGQLDRVAAAMQGAGDREVLIEGYADSLGTEAANLALAGRRAEAAADYLAARGVPADRMLAISWGETARDGITERRSVIVALRPLSSP